MMTSRLSSFARGLFTLTLLAPAALATGCVIVEGGGSGVSCEYAGETYEAGESFQSVDGCNTCSCNEDGEVGCTEMACEPPVCEMGGQFYNFGESWSDGCNTCSCMDDGSIACTAIWCATCEYDGASYNAGESFPAADGCNTCSCMDDGQVACTEMACVSCTYEGNTYPSGETFPAGDGCNSCICMDDGQVACTDMACTCDPANEPNRDYVSLDPAECQLIDFDCSAPQVRFDNDCGCGCETPTP